MVLAEAIGLVVLGFAGFLLFTGARELSPAYHILRNDPIPVRDLHGHTGTVAIQGTATVDDGEGTVTAPFSGRECLAYTYEVAELRSTGKHSEWETLDEGMGGTNFLVDDGTGAVRVNPDGADVRLEAHTVQVSPGEELPDRLAAYVESTEAVDAQDGTVDMLLTELHVGNKQRFVERRLDAGESVYVYGQARRGANTEWGSDHVDAVVGDGPGAAVFVISDTNGRGTAWRFVKSGLQRAGLGAFLLVVLAWVVFRPF